MSTITARNDAAVGEFITEARIDSLNSELAAHGVDASRIISIFRLPAEPVANAAPERYRVLYRKA
jgi:hypothetical protein